MREYNKKRPLIAIHIPKTGGTSFEKNLASWFSEKLYKHYYDMNTGQVPEKIRLKDSSSSEYREGICIYGHFNKTKGLGIERNYPEVDQFITILREPFERAVSGYFFLSKHRFNKSTIPGEDIEHYLMTSKQNFLNHFPFELTRHNYKELLNRHFIHIGITEDMATSVNIIAKKLRFSPLKKNEILNKTERTKKIPYHLREEFMKKHLLEYEIYDYVKENYDKY